MPNKKISLSRLETFLKQQCDNLRAAGLDAAEYKDYIIAMLFLKRVNDQFEVARDKRTRNLLAEYPDLTQDEINEELEVENSPEYEFFVPVRARWKFNYTLGEDPWKGLFAVNENVGDALTIALNALEESNKEVLDGVLSTTKFNAVNSKGEKLLKDELLAEMVRDFNSIRFTDDNFEFPDLLGAAYEFLIKYFAESAGKKGGEFYTPNPVVQLMGRILQPAIDAEICDPTVGSGGLIINLRNQVEARYGTAEHLSLYGQELKDGTYKMCKMNMIFHGIRNANIQQGDTLTDPRLIRDGKLRTFDIVVANPPFSQNYTTAGMKFKERFHNWMSTKKQADFMFVQHMIATLKNNGRMAVVMPHGVLFRGGEEQRMRQRIIEQGILECIIGLPPALFYGTGIPASILIINKAGAHERDGVFFINADREYKEGKNQNTLRPEDIEKISYIYHNKIEQPKYSRFVTKAELAAEEYNCNIRRYVDNAPPATPNDVHAHIKGGIPDVEIDALDPWLDCYDGVKASLFEPLKPGYSQFTPQVTGKEAIKPMIATSAGLERTYHRYREEIAGYWQSVLPEMEALPEKGEVYHFTQLLTERFCTQLGAIELGILDEFQVRGAFAQYLDDLGTDFKSVAASGWNSELIPENDILESQFSQVLASLRAKQARKEELEAMFAEVAELEEGEWNEESYEVIPKAQITEIKSNIKQLNSQCRELEKQLKTIEKRLKAYRTAEEEEDIEQLKEEAAGYKAQVQSISEARETTEAAIQRHLALEAELKECTTMIRAIERQKEDLVEQARDKITPEEAKPLIINRWYELLQATVASYLEAHTRTLQQAVEQLHDKYTVTLSEIVAERDQYTQLLNSYLEELGYE